MSILELIIGLIVMAIAIISILWMVINSFKNEIRTDMTSLRQEIIYIHQEIKDDNRKFMDFIHGL
jgi:hypothetical protein